MKGVQKVDISGPLDAPIRLVQATTTTTVVQETSIDAVPDMYTTSTDEALIQSRVESNKPFAKWYPRGVRSRQDPSSSASTALTSAASSSIVDSSVLLSTTSPASPGVLNGGENPNPTWLAGRSQEALALGTPGGSSFFFSPPSGGRPTTPGTGARRKPVPSLVPPSVLVTAVGGEREKEEQDANGNISSSTLPFPPPPPLPHPPSTGATGATGDAEGPDGTTRRSRTYSDDTLAVMEEQRRKRAVLHGHQHDAESPTPDDASAELGPGPGPEEKEDGEDVDRSAAGDGVVPFPTKVDSAYYPPSTTQRQLLQATGASARRRREQVRGSTYTDGTKATNGKAFKGWMGKLRRFKIFGVKIWWIMRP